ncbi:MAG: YfhO family protein [Elusimicrobia bacterium]|nr:YfhO family protein [Elusimicrobiota bacterium]
MAAVSIVLLFALIVLHFKAIFLFGLFTAQHSGAGDSVLLYFPSRFFLGHSLRIGEFPLWSRNMFLGFPIHAEGQGGFFYPLNILFGIFPQWAAFNYVNILNVFLGGFFMYIFTRQLNLKKLSSVIASLVFAFSGFFICHLEHINLLNACVWIPLGFLFILRRKYLMISLIFALQLLSGFPQIAYYTGIILFFWLIFNMKEVTDIFKFLFSSIFAVLLSFCQILPTIELIPYSVRNKGVDPSDMFSWGYYFKDLLLFIHPYIFGNPVLGTYIRKDSILTENCAFIGIMTLLLVAFGIIKNMKVKWVKFFTVFCITIIGFLLVFPVISKMVAYIPGFQFFRLPQRLLIFVVFALAVISAYGFQCLKKFRLVVFSVIFIEFMNFGFGYNNVVGMEYFNTPESISFLKDDKEFFRILTVDDEKKASISNYILSTIPGTSYFTEKRYLNYVPPNIGVFFNMPTLNIYSPLSMVNESKLFKLAKSNAKYIFSSTDLTDKNLVFIKMIQMPLFLPNLRIYRNTDYVSHAFFSDNEKQKQLPLKVKYYSNNKIRIEKNINVKGNITLSDLYYPGWTVFVDGRRSKIYSTDSMTRLVNVSRISKKIYFIFLPVSFTIGISLSVFSIFLSAWLISKCQGGNK